MAITRNHALLLAIIAELFAMLRSVGVGSGPLSVDPGSNPATQSFTLPRHLYAAILLILRPAESAIRRLIVIAARGIVIKFRPSRPLPAGLASFASRTGSHTPSFQLIDPLKHFEQEAWENELNAGSMQEVLPFNAAEAYHQATLAAQPINATLLFNRLRAMRHALNDLPRQARRLARWRARRDQILSSKAPYKPTRISPFRPGPPPGYRRKDIHPVDSILKDVHYFAVEAFRWKPGDSGL